MRFPSARVQASIGLGVFMLAAFACVPAPDVSREDDDPYGELDASRSPDPEVDANVPDVAPDGSVVNDAGADATSDAANDVSNDVAPDGAVLPTPLCTSGVGYSYTYNTRDVYLAEFDIDGLWSTVDGGMDAGDGGDAGPPCPLRPMPRLPYDEKLTVGFLAGSPGYSIDARVDYELANAVNGTVRGGGIAIDALEGNVVSFDFMPRPPAVIDGGADADAGDASVPAQPVWHIMLRMNEDPDPAKWTVTLYRFDKE